MWAFKRRISIVLLILATFFCVVVIPYYLTHREAPSCFDTKLNQGEEGIDCGGPCAIVCKGKAQELSILWKHVDLVRPGIYEAAIFVENKNISVGAMNIPYEVTLRSSDGSNIASRKGTTYAGSNESFLIYEGNIEVGNRTPEEVDITFGPFTWVSTPKRQSLFSVSDEQLTQFETKPRLFARVRNDTPVPQEDIEIDAMVSDDANEVVGYGKTLIDRLLPGETRQVTFTWTRPFVYQAALESCDRPVDIMLLLDRSGSMESEGKNPSEPLTTALNAASFFTSFLRPQDQAGVISFATEVQRPVDRQLTKDSQKIREAIGKISITRGTLQYTNIGEAIKAAGEEFESRRHDPKATAAIVLLTDGDPTYPIHPDDKNYPLVYANNQAEAVKQKGISLFAIGLGGDVKTDVLTSLASKPENYFFAKSAQDLREAYTKVSQVLCKKAPSVVEVIPRVNNVTE